MKDYTGYFKRFSIFNYSMISMDYVNILLKYSSNEFKYGVGVIAYMSTEYNSINSFE